MNEILHTEADAKAALYAAMRRGTDPRWQAEPIAPMPRRSIWQRLLNLLRGYNV